MLRRTNQTQKEQILFGLSYTWTTKQKQDHRHKEQIVVARGRGGGEGETNEEGQQYNQNSDLKNKKENERLSRELLIKTKRIPLGLPDGLSESDYPGGGALDI